MVIPLRLALSNFMCYREGAPPLDLTSVHLACLTGDNGAGKSALLDAITWVLWGKARVNTDRELMHLGSAEMSVEFEFRLGERDFRVSRRCRSRASTLQSWLDLQAREPDAETWHSLTGGTKSDTQTAIDDLLKMQYETFINSAFILQGRADEFTTKRPGERKEVLAEILGLGVYDGLERRARERGRAADAALRETDDRLLRLAEQAAQAADARTSIDALATELADHDRQLALVAARLEAAQAQRGALQEKERHLADLRRQVVSSNAQRQRLGTQLARVETTIGRLADLQGRRAQIEANAAEYRAANERRAVLDEAADRLATLTRERHRYERAIDAARHALEAELQAIRRGLPELTAQAESITGLESRRLGLEATLAAAAAALAEEAAVRRRERQEHAETETLKADNKRLMEEMRRLKERQEQVDGADASCPVCRRPLGEQEKHQIHEDYQRDGLALRDRYTANTTTLKALDASLTELAARLADLERQRQRTLQLNRDLAALDAQLQTAKDAATKLETARQRETALDDQLRQARFLPEEQAGLTATLRAIEALGYDETAHRLVRETVARTEPAARQAEELARADAELPDLQRERDDLLHDIDRVAEQVTRAAGEAAALEQDLKELPAIAAAVEAHQRALASQQRERDALQHEVGRQRERLALAETAAAAAEDVKRGRAGIVEERELYQDLAEAFGKKGIQAMIIETVVPELQDEANALLDRMPGNTMRIELQTQRATRGGDAVETLDVVIKDDVGPRRYELYSGGEAFRANFAVRVALSKLLARRAGAQLQLLIIDEGFGTQDARGREGLVEAIRSIEHDFATVLVITHLTDIRDEFPRRIEVTKTVDGSVAILH